ncbi:uncharacterized protein LOC131325778 isoform X2 [Rhododendron vialii]|uniref:uncharacterized protein LOC131325778 isoform X2 n=1 Tax=Rhododendron vialii TaxID=182163 RepID=UPI00266051E6|nr:uncharacterized protein LOC131325778 isoform X2 [Rhododendron vialii]
MAATVSNRKIVYHDETADGGLMAPCRRGENADSEISSDVRSDERFIDKYVPPPRAFASSEENKDEGGKDRKPDYFHVSTPRGQGTDSHSLAERERVRREKIGERMKYLQDLVPGCSKIVGKGERLDKIIKYIQSLETRVKFLVAVRFSLDFNIDSFFVKEVKKLSQSPITNKELAHCCQATDSHCLAERVRRENIRDRLKYLEDLVPVCNKIKGYVGRLNRIIDYIEYLQEKVEFLSPKVAAVNPSPDFNIDSFFAKEVFLASTSMEFDTPDNGAHLGRPYQSGPNSEKKDMREQLSEECLTKSVLSFDDTTKQKSLPDLRTLTPLGQYFADEILNKNKKIFNGAVRFDDLMPPFTRGENP